MGDGAHLGVTAGRALQTILGGTPQPIEKERKEQEEFAAWIQSDPHRLEDVHGDDAYTEASRWLAGRYLLILRQAPAIDRNTAWEVFKTKWANDAEEAGGMTGFMHGWAWNAALHYCQGRRNRTPRSGQSIFKSPSGSALHYIA